MISGVKHVSIPVKNQDKALKFYTEKLGFEVLMDAEFDSQRWIELKIPGGETQVVLFTPEGHEDRVGTFSNIVFMSDDIQNTVKELRAKGVKFTKDLTEEHWGTYALFEDAEGNTFCLSSA
ncbi:MAG: VOC family protein [Verrucomicrobia bacterium]|nr:VOC family protein [Verrucomicrobiota bacterium]